MGNIIEAKKINAGYGKRQILWDVSLEVREGEKLLLIGPNGSGKSTLLKVLVGIVKPYSGSVHFKGIDITKFPVSKRIKLGISYLPQTRNVFPRLTVEENFKLSCFYCENGYFKKRMDWIFSIFPFLRDVLDKRAGLLSGGQRQALSVGMALMRKMEILIVDEPTAGLSPKAAVDILNGIKKAHEDEGFSVLMVEHNLKYLSGWFDRAVVMRQGKILFEESNVSKLLKRENLERAFFGEELR